MNSADDEEGFQRRHIAQEILSLQARDVLNLEKVRDPLSLRMNMKGALKNWEDVAGLLGYSPEMIFGLFAHDSFPGLMLLKDWMYKKNGILGRLVDVFTILEMYNCLEVIYECVAEYEKTSMVSINEPTEDDDDDIQPQSLTSDSSDATGSHTTSTDYSTEQESSISSTSTLPPVSPIVVTSTDSKNFSSEVDNSSTADYGMESTRNCLSCHNFDNDNTGHETSTTQKQPDLFRLKSWSPSGCHGTLTDHRQSVDGGRNLFNRSVSHPADIMKSKVGSENKKKSIKKKISKFFKKGKQSKKSPVPSRCEIAVDSSPNTLTTTSFTVTGSHSESAEKPCDNFSPLKVEEARRLSLTDSLSSGESLSLPTSPGYESGYMSSEGPSVSSGKSISIIHCSDLEKESLIQNEVFKLYNHFSEKLGYKCYLDKLEMLEIAENKFRYAVRRVQHSDFLFICVSPELKKIFDSSVDEISEQLEDDGSCMLRLVSDLILNDLANHGSNRKGKFMTIILEGSSKRDVPCFLDSFMKFLWPKDERKIRCIIEGQPEILPVPVSDVKTDPPSQVVSPAGLI